MWSDLKKIDIEPIYEEMLYNFLHSNGLELDDKLEVSTLFDYLQNAFDVDDNFHKNMLRLANQRIPPILRVDVKCTEGKSLRSTSHTGAGSFMVTIFKTSSPDHVNSTQIQIGSNNPKWTEQFSIPIVKTTENEAIEFQVFDCCPDHIDNKKSDSSSESGSIRGFKSLIKELAQSVSKSKKLVGRASVPLKSIKHDSIDVWLDLDKKGDYSNRGQIKVQVKYCAGKTKDVILEEYQCMIHHLLWHELKVSRVAEYWWDGKFSEPGEAILRAYLSRVHLSDLDITISKWTTFSKVHIRHPLSFILFDSLLNKFLKLLNDSLSDTELKYIWEGAARLLPSCLTMIKDQIAQKTHDGTLKVILNITAKLQTLIDRTNGKNEVFNFSIFKALEIAVIDGANEWFDKQLDEHNISQKIDSDNISNITNFTHMLKTDLTEAMQLDEIFLATNNLRFTKTLYIVYDEKLACILENILNKTYDDWQVLYYAFDQPDVVQEAQEKNITVALFELYLTLKELLAMSAKITAECELFQLNRCQIWFSGALTHWLELGVEKALISIEEAVIRDNFEPEHEDAKYSSSAIDTLGIFCQVKYIWDQLEWTDDLGSFMIIGKIIYDICRLCSFYASKIQSSLENLHLNHNHTQTNYQITRQWCLAINNIEFIRSKISTFINAESIDSMVTRISHLYNSFEGERAAETFQNIMEYINDIKNQTILQSIKQVIRHLSLDLRRNLTTVVNSGDFKSKCIDDLFNYIDQSMYTLRTDLNSANFETAVELLWIEVINILEDIIAQAVRKRNPSDFYSNLQHFFYNIVYIVTTVKPSNENFMKDCPSLLYIDNLIRLNGLETRRLIHQYHLVRAQSQNDMFNAMNATLTVRCHSKNDDLFIEILNARNLETVLPAHGPKCNPIIKVHLLPFLVYNFEYTTKPHQNNTVLFIEETFSIKLPPDDRFRDDSLILFTVWNRSGLFKIEEFLGECYIALRDIPTSFVERQTHLNLTRSNDVTQTVLKILEARHRYDKEAQVFLKSISKRNTLYPKCCMF